MLTAGSSASVPSAPDEVGDAGPGGGWHVGVSDQATLWNGLHAQHWSGRYARKESTFARSVAAAIKGNQRILELGCGSGADAIYLQQAGHAVTATDFSEFVVDCNSRETKSSGVRFVQHDSRKPLPFPDCSFDVVYSRLSLHYFDDSTTRAIVNEIYRTLAHGGELFFMCKSTEDPLYGKGVMLEKDVFELDGHVRHFFTKMYARSVLAATCEFEIRELRQRDQAVYGEPSAIVVCRAQKPGPTVQLRLF